MAATGATEAAEASVWATRGREPGAPRELDELGT